MRSFGHSTWWPLVFPFPLIALATAVAAQPPPQPPRPDRATQEKGTKLSKPTARARKKAQLGLPAPPPAPDAQAVVLQAATGASPCRTALSRDGHVATVAPQPSRDQRCAIDDPVRLETVSVGEEGGVTLPDRPILSCKFASSFASYVAAIVAPLGRATLGAGVASISTGPGYECRGRNRAKDAKISAHGRGLAVDIAVVRLRDGRQVVIRDMSGDSVKRYVAGIRQAACGWFTTVLGPGSDAYHNDHLHFDLETHGSSDRYRICQ